MRQPPRDPEVADQAPTGNMLTSYDEEHVLTNLRLLDAERYGANWPEVARIVRHIGPAREPERARRAWKAICAV